MNEWISVWDRRAIVMFHGPIRTATGHIHEYTSDGKCKFCDKRK